MVPIGLIIKRLIKEKGYTVSKFAQRIHCSRRTLYDIFNKNSVNTELLTLMSKELNVNIFKEISKYVDDYLEKDYYYPKNTINPKDNKLDIFSEKENVLSFKIKDYKDTFYDNNLFYSKRDNDINRKNKDTIDKILIKLDRINQEIESIKDEINEIRNSLTD